MTSATTPRKMAVRTLLAISLAALTSSVFAQPGVPPIPMTQREFNQGRPAAFYYLADATQGYEDVCNEVLAALNEPYPGEPYAEYNEPYSKYFLRSRLSVPWVQMPMYFLGRNNYDVRYASIDIDNDDLQEDVFVAPMFLTSTPVHYFWIVEKGILPESFTEISDQAWISLRDSGASAVGQRLAGRISSDISRTIRDPEIASPHLSIGGTRNYFDVIQLNSVRYILRTTQSIPEQLKDTYLFRWSADDSLDRLCRLRSRYIVGE